MDLSMDLSLDEGPTNLHRTGPLGSQQQAAAAQIGTLSCVVNLGSNRDGVLTRLLGLGQQTVCGFTSNEPIASFVAGNFLAETAFSFVGMDDRRDGC